MNHVEMAQAIIEDNNLIEFLGKRVTHLERVLKAIILTHGSVTFNPVEDVSTLDKLHLLERIGKFTVNEF